MGHVITLLILAAFIAFPFWFSAKFGRRIRENQRKRRIETAMNTVIVDARLADQVGRQVGEQLIRDEQGR